MGRIVGPLVGMLVCAAGCAAVPPPVPPPPPPPAAEPDLPAEVRALLERRCAGCHVSGPRDAAGWGSVLDVPRMVEARIVVPGDPGHSPLIGQLVVGEMPRKGPRLRAPEVELLERWIRGMVPVVLGSLK
jgi:mono/diheme cytochrome c family protein